MNEFSAAIAAFSAGHVGFAQLEATLARALQQDPAIAPAAFAEIDRLYKTGLLPLQIYVGLKNLIAQSASAAQRPPAAPVRPPTLPPRAAQPQVQAPAAAAPPDEATLFPARRQQALGPGAVLKRRFVLEDEVGRGGMGVVFRAKDRRKEEVQDRDPYVAIKILNDEFRRHPESLIALQREARRSQQLAHPNIVSVFDFDRDGSTVYMTMEFLEGQPLDRIIKRPGFAGMSFADAYPLIKGIASGLAYAHEKGIVHSDFKPGNCFVTKNGVVKVFDFGIARASKVKTDAEADVTRFDAVSLGALTPAYASTEMTAGGAPDPRDDIYALGCVIYELLTGEHPFGRKSATEARSARLAARPIRKLTRPQWRALEKALVFRRADRTATVRELVDALAETRRSRVPARIAIGAAALGLAAVVAYFGAGILQQQRHADLAAALSSGDDALVTPALESLAALDPVLRASLLNDVAEPLLTWYERRVNAAADRERGPYDFRRAAAIVTEAKGWYPDSARLEDLRRRKEEQAATLVKDLEVRFNAAVAAGRLLPDPRQDDVGDVIEILWQVDPARSPLDRERLVAEYTRRANEALSANDRAGARSLVDAGIARFPDEPSLRAIAASFTASTSDRAPTVSPTVVAAPAPPAPERAPEAAPERAAEAAPEPAPASSPSEIDRIKSAFESFVRGGDALAARAALEQLRARLAPNDPYLADTPPQMAELFLNHANALFDARDYGGAQTAADDGLREWPSSTVLAALFRLSGDVDTLRTRIASGAAGDANADQTLRSRIRSDAGARFGAIDRDLIAMAERSVAQDPADDAYVAYVTTVFERAFGGGVSSAPTQPVAFDGGASSAPAQPVATGGGASSAETQPVSAPSPIPSASPGPSAPPASTNGRNVEAPEPLLRVPPDYPPRALSRGMEGWVRVRFTITASGNVADAVVLDSQPKEIFDQAALRAISRWRYAQRGQDSLPTELVGVQTVISFTLQE